MGAILAEDSIDWQRRRPRHVSPGQWVRFEQNIAEILVAFGMEPNTPGTDRTPERFLKALYDATEGYEGDGNLLTAFPAEFRGPGSELAQIIEGPIAFHSLCEHHALPFHGTAMVGYIAGDEIIGISKLTRLVRLFAKRFTVQERLGNEIVEALDGMLDARGVAVHIQAVHLCTQMRGVRELESSTRTSFWSRAYLESPALRAEFLTMCGLGLQSRSQPA